MAGRFKCRKIITYEVYMMALSLYESLLKVKEHAVPRNSIPYKQTFSDSCIACVILYLNTVSYEQYVLDACVA